MGLGSAQRRVQEKKGDAHFCGHDSVAAGEVETLLDVVKVEDVPVRKHGHLDGLLDRSYLLPVREPLLDTTSNLVSFARP